MTTPTYAYGPSQLPTPIVSKISGGNFTAAIAGTYYFCLQGQNRVGRNELSLPTAGVTVAAGDSLDVEIPVEARTACSDWHYFVLSVSTSTDPSTFQQIALYRGYEADQVTPTALPYTFAIDEDEHLRPGMVVLEPAGLPTDEDLLEGMVRGVISTTYFYTYDPESTATPDGITVLEAYPDGRWLRSGPPDTYIDDINDVGGCARDIRDLGEAPVLLPQYNVAASDRTPGTPIKLWRINTTSEPIPAGTRVGIVVQYGEEQKSQTFNGLLQVDFLGYANPETGELDQQNEFNDGLMAEIGISPYQARKSNLMLEKDLPVGQAYAIEIYPEFAAFELDGEIAIGGRLKVYVFFYLNPGEFSEAGLALGEDWIYPVEDKRRVVPDNGLGVMLLPGSYMVDSFSVRGLKRTLLPGLAADTPDQKICINGIGASWIETGEMNQSSALRALVGTVSGRGSASGYSSYTAITANGQIRLTIPHPCDASGFGTVRPDYPDRVAGNTKGRFNPSSMTFYVQRQSTGEIRAFSGNLVVIAPNQVVTIPDWTVGNVVTQLSVAAQDFGLYAAPIPVVSALVGGNFPSGNYRVSVAYDYLNRVTSISHAELDGCMPEPDATLVEVFDRIRYHAQGAANLDTLRALPLSSLTDMQLRAVKTPRKLYQYDISSTEVDDGSATSRFVRPTVVPPEQPGRFVQYNELFEVGTVETGLEGEEAQVWIGGGGGLSTINFRIPEGRRGRAGEVTTLRIGEVSIADFEYQASATIRGVAPHQILDLVLPKGDRGMPGPRGNRGPTGATGNPMDIVQFINFESLYG